MFKITNRLRPAGATVYMTPEHLARSMGNLSDICAGCGCIGADPMTLVLRDEEVTTPRGLCTKCFMRALADFEMLRHEFAQLIEDGVHPKIAARIMDRRVSETIDQQRADTEREAANVPTEQT